jgi:hypothetical protein
MPGTADLAQIAPALEQLYRARIVRQQNRSDVTMSLIRKVAGGGKNCAYDVSVGSDTGQVFDDGQIVSVYNNDTEAPAILQWSEVGDAFKLTGKAQDAAAGSATELGNLFLKKLTDARMRAAEKGNTEIILGDGSPAPQRMQGLMATGGGLDSSGTYAGISRTTYAQWAGNKLSNAGVPRAISLSLVEQLFDLIFTAGGGKPTWGVTTPVIWSALGQLVNDTKRINQDIYIRGEKLSADMGYESIIINGVPIFRDKAWPAGSLAVFNDENIQMVYLPVAPDRMARGSKFIGMLPLSGTPQELAMSEGKLPNGAGQPLMAALIELPAAGDLNQYMLKATCTVSIDRCNAHGLITDIAA